MKNNLEFDGEKYSIRIPKALQPYMGGKTVIEEK
jgi:seryl-tRNA synthetase